MDDPASETAIDPAAIGRNAAVVALPLTRPDIVAVPGDAFGDDAGDPVADVGPAGGVVLLPQAVATTVMAMPITDFKYADRIGLPPAASGSLSVV